MKKKAKICEARQCQPAANIERWECGEEVARLGKTEGHECNVPDNDELFAPNGGDFCTLWLLLEMLIFTSTSEQ
ncbi:hypothetical protein E2C01_082666 [Portunus trituberculatus]|uniref:Uncharacterized protein n=1 Tax=Portunus trituberculatus TaxID=210409 RepID=A0A5B7IZW3_PORTR|nr:hypothetical protein [Portunus trituberculatus]